MIFNLVLMKAQQKFEQQMHHKVPFSEMEESFLKQSVLEYDMGKWTSILNDNNYKFHSSWKVSTLAIRAKKLFK